MGAAESQGQLKSFFDNVVFLLSRTGLELSLLPGGEESAGGGGGHGEGPSPQRWEEVTERCGQPRLLHPSVAGKGKAGGRAVGAPLHPTAGCWVGPLLP